MADIQKIVNEAWNGPHAPSVMVDGSQVRLLHPFGQSVTFALKRSDLALPPQQFADAILAPAFDALRKSLSP